MRVLQRGGHRPALVELTERHPFGLVSAEEDDAAGWPPRLEASGDGDRWSQHRWFVGNGGVSSTSSTSGLPSVATEDAPPFRYSAALAAEIEERWQERWEKEGTLEAPNPAGPMAEPDKVAGRPKLFVMDMFPYPSGLGLHVGHPLGFIGTDVFARYQRMKGRNVLHTMGFDAFGLPAEQHAIATGVHPRINTERNIAVYRRQLRRLGLGHDARRSISTTDESYYRWTQWIFLQIFKRVVRPGHRDAPPDRRTARGVRSGNASDS
jgi:hypothetical protein